MFNGVRVSQLLALPPFVSFSSPLPISRLFPLPLPSYTHSLHSLQMMTLQGILRFLAACLCLRWTVESCFIYQTFCLTDSRPETSARSLCICVCLPPFSFGSIYFWSRSTALYHCIFLFWFCGGKSINLAFLAPISV